MMKKGFTDMHCHIIPGVDDGATELKMAQEMVKMAYAHGTRRIIATPHFWTRRAKADQETIRVQFDLLQDWVEEAYPEMELYLGQELTYHHGLEKRIKNGEGFTMSDSHYALVEFQPEDDYARIRNGLEGMILSGYKPILAHAERCQCLLKHIDKVEALIDMGVYIQVNASSVTGGNGWGTKRGTWKMLKQEMVHFIGSDAHELKRRVPVVDKAMEDILKKCGKDYAMALAVYNPEQVLLDQDI